MDGKEESKSGDNGIKIFLSFLWIVSLIISGSIGFTWGQGNKPDEATKVLSASNTLQASVTATPTPQHIVSSTNKVVGPLENTPTLTPTPTPTVVSPTCSKTGFAQKWEYLTPYVVKQGDTMQTIAKEQLNDETRVNEILKINGLELIIGATLYLPPSMVTKSSGNLKQVYGKLMGKNTASWHVAFSNDAKGQGILIPSFWFEKISNRDAFKIGDCIKVFFDDGFTVYSVALQE